MHATQQFFQCFLSFLLACLLAFVLFTVSVSPLKQKMGKQANHRKDNAKPPTTVGSSLIPLINKLQDIIAPFGGELSKISLPQVAVVGSQSSGKSSVLEALVGRDFLPRGCDICTRRPLSLMLEHRPVGSDDDDDREWGEFRHLPGKRFYDFSLIRREIQEETEREAGYRKGVSDKQIRLKISSPNVLNMTLIDLPGITKVPVGDQPSDIETRIRKMIMTYISQENCIILAVSPANSDLATSDALQIAKAADPSGSRTIGVITKLDIMDRGTNARNFLLGKVVPLHLGYIGVVNRSQEDINHNRSIQEALAREEQFFHDHPEYNGLSDHCGISKLAKKLNQILEQHIRMVLPNLKGELNSRMVAVVKELHTYGEVVESKAEQGVVLLNILTRYFDAFTAMVDGNSQDVLTNELCGGARIHYIFQSVFVKGLEEVDPCEKLSDDDIRMAIQNAAGLSNALFVPGMSITVPFAVLVRREIARLLDPSVQCLRFVYDELIKISRACQAAELRRFPHLRMCVDEVMGKFLHDGVKPAESMITSLIEMEMDYINSSHPNFLGGKKAVELAMQQLRSSQVNQPQSNDDKSASAGWGIPSISILRSKASFGESSARRSPGETIHDPERSSATIRLREPSAILKPEMTQDEMVEIIVTKLLLQSYYNIVRKNIQDLVPKAIVHYLVTRTKKDLNKTLMQKLYRENLFEELLQEQEEVVGKRKQAQEVLHVLQQAVKTLGEFESDISSQCSSSNPDVDTNSGLSRFSACSAHLHSTAVRENGSSDASITCLLCRGAGNLEL